jgi:hypothetical protein
MVSKILDCVVTIVVAAGLLGYVVIADDARRPAVVELSGALWK